MDRQEYEVMARVEYTLWWYVGMRKIADAWLHKLPTTQHRERYLMRAVELVVTSLGLVDTETPLVSIIQPWRAGTLHVCRSR